MRKAFLKESFIKDTGHIFILLAFCTCAPKIHAKISKYTLELIF